MRETKLPEGIDTRPQRTVDPAEAASPHGPAFSPAEQNQLNDKDIPDLETKAQRDLKSKVNL